MGKSKIKNNAPSYGIGAKIEKQKGDNMIIDNKKIAIYDHGTKGKTYEINGLTMEQCGKVLRKVYEMHENVDTKRVKLSLFSDKCYGYILAK